MSNNMPTLTKRQKQIFDYINEYINKHGYSPTFEEIKKHFRLSAFSTVHQHIEALLKKDYIKKNNNSSRGIELKEQMEMTRVQLLGTIAAGSPIEVFEEYETITVPKNLLSKSGEHFVLKVKGNSMIQEGIFDGDNVVIRKQNTAENGDTVVALINDNEVTLKKIYKVVGGFKLQPANPTVPALIVKQIIVQGKVISVMRNYEARRGLDQTLNLFAFNDELKQLIIKVQAEIKVKFKPNKQFETWQKTENKPDQDKFCLETGYTFLNEIILLWVCKDKRLLNFEIIQDEQRLTSLKIEAQKIYSHIFSNNLFDWYKPSDLILQEITNSFNRYDFTRIDRDILGKLYEQFITREERKKLGQPSLKFFKKLKLDIIQILSYNSRNN